MKSQYKKKGINRIICLLHTIVATGLRVRTGCCFLLPLPKASGKGRISFFIGSFIWVQRDFGTFYNNVMSFQPLPPITNIAVVVILKNSRTKKQSCTKVNCKEGYKINTDPAALFSSVEAV